ncbi:PREDICTED: uncharacterized protein LOC105450232 [Wasmannia auropunctata]|uniref:uncharacterized protein LOC105450232 n=1 Tax=Wasmannia auropunctata TaxID=64793 RepID=UPI0005EEA5EA|nr:PREDICTED: uncharacterized protein LOC105450232 [Wasmannia auropunctata]
MADLTPRGIAIFSNSAKNSRDPPDNETGGRQYTLATFVSPRAAAKISNPGFVNRQLLEILRPSQATTTTQVSLDGPSGSTQINVIRITILLLRIECNVIKTTYKEVKEDSSRGEGGLGETSGASGATLRIIVASLITPLLRIGR